MFTRIQGRQGVFLFIPDSNLSSEEKKRREKKRAKERNYRHSISSCETAEEEEIQKNKI